MLIYSPSSTTTTFFSKQSVTITRTADTNPYIADDVWGGRFALTLPFTGDGNKAIILNKINISNIFITSNLYDTKSNNIINYTNVNFDGIVSTQWATVGNNIYVNIYYIF